MWNRTGTEVEPMWNRIGRTLLLSGGQREQEHDNSLEECVQLMDPNTCLDNFYCNRSGTNVEPNWNRSGTDVEPNWQDSFTSNINVTLASIRKMNVIFIIVLSSLSFWRLKDFTTHSQVEQWNRHGTKAETNLTYYLNLLHFSRPKSISSLFQLCTASTCKFPLYFV
jgi:hypothetical protein